MAARSTRWPRRRRLSVALFRLFSWPFGVGHPPHVSYPEFQLDLRPGIQPTSNQQIDRALATLPGLETDIVATLRTILRDAFSRHAEAPEVFITVANTHVRVQLVPPATDGQPSAGLEALVDRWGLTIDDRGRPILLIDRRR